MELSNFLSPLLRSFSVWSGRKRKYVLSIALNEESCRWVYGEVKSGASLHFERIVRSGALDVDPDDFKNQDLCSSTHWKKLINKIMSSLLPSDPKVEGVVFCLPFRYGYIGEMTIEQGLDEASVRYQIEDMLEIVAGREQYSAAYDWHVKQDLSDGSKTIAIASIDAKHLNEITEVCTKLKLVCFGITLDSVASVNGYLSMLPDAHKSLQLGFLIYAELNRMRVRLSVFSGGVLLNEVFESSEEGFSVIQAVSALERLVASWTRDSSTGPELSIRMVIGGELTESKNLDTTVRRSAVLSPMVIDIPPRRELAATWHRDVVPYGALEFLPCE
jgi:hypothetical protein